jgi:HEAT repeat protein
LPEEEAARLGAEFLKASGSKQEELLKQLKQSKGGEYTAALAAAIDQVGGPLKTKAREALAERLARMTAATLREMLHDEVPEVRRAASLACAMKEEKQFIPELAKLLEDSEPAVVRAAYSALKALTGEDFGPSPHASLDSRRRAASAYSEWWEKQSRREPRK